MNILIIDDNEIDLFIGTRVLNNCGFKNKIATCNSISGSLSLLNEALNQNKNIPSLILLDVIMPQYDIFYFLEKFDELFIATELKPNIIVYSASLSSNHKEKLMLHPSVIDYIDKPLTHEYVKACVMSKYYMNEFANLKE